MIFSTGQIKGALIVAACLSLTAIQSCKKQSNTTTPTNTVGSMNQVKAPAGFNWESSRNVPFTISITDTRFGDAKHSIAIYNGDPYNGGELLSKGSASTSTPFTNTLYIPGSVSEVYIVKTSPDRSSIVKKVTIAATVSMSFGAIDPDAGAKKAAARTTAGPDCSTGCTNTITTNASNVNVSSGDVVCITGNNITVGFNSVKGGTIRVCGTNVTLSNLNLDGTAALIITSTGTATASSLNYNSSSASITVYGTLSGNFADGGVFTNYGTVNMSSDFNINGSAGTFTNDGVMNVGGSFNNGGKSTATNNGQLVITKNFQQNGGAGTFVNKCTMIVKEDYNQSAAVENYNLIKVGKTATINSSTTLEMFNGAMLLTKDFILDGSVIKGTGSTSLVKITGSVNIRNSGAVITGAMQVCATSSISSTYMTGGTIASCSLYIPVTGCNADGNGTPTITDTDKDGVADSTDDYPSDATKAYDNYYPSAKGTATVAFEDQWPSKADFDLNDVVMGYRYQVVTNAGNDVVQVKGTYTLLATGGELGNGFGVEFPVARKSVSSVSGGTLEAGQTKAVVILFENMRNEMTYWNTVVGSTTSSAKTYNISFDVATGTSLKTFGLNAYNPFIWNFGIAATRGREMHLPGHTPTDLADTKLFGTADDSTVASAGRYYLTKTGLPYALDVPAVFEYPAEKVDITQAYLNFAAWAQSGNTTYTDWYSNTGTGYRNTKNIYK